MQIIIEDEEERKRKKRRGGRKGTRKMTIMIKQECILFTTRIQYS